jgi:tetratricopeptide (TPR) repeat protein
VKLYEKILDSKSDVATLWSELGWSLYFCNKYADAKKVFQKTLSLNKQFHPAYRALGWIDYQLGQFDQAIPSFNEALKTIQSSDGAHAFQETLRGRGWAYFHQQHFNEAIGDFTKALEYTQPDEKNALQDLLRGRGWAYCAMNCFKEGEQDFSKAIELIDPQDRSVLEDAKKGLAVAQKAEKEGFKVGSKSPKAKPILGTDASHLPGLTGRVKNKIKKILSPFLKR